MKLNKNTKENRKHFPVFLLITGIIVLALFLELGILNYVTTQNVNKTTLVLLDQVIDVIERNKKNEDDLITSLKDEYIIRAKAVSYIIDANPSA